HVMTKLEPFPPEKDATVVPSTETFDPLTVTEPPADIPTTSSGAKPEIVSLSPFGLPVEVTVAFGARKIAAEFSVYETVALTPLAPPLRSKFTEVITAA